MFWGTVFFAGPKAGTQHKSQALAMAQCLDLHPEVGLPAPSHPLEHHPHCSVQFTGHLSSAEARAGLLYLYKPAAA